MAATLIIGGTRSGKSALAEKLAHATGLARVYLATAGMPGDDSEFGERITAHRARRGDGWQTVEEQTGIAPLIAGRSAAQVVLVDCLTLWLSNLMAGAFDIEAETEALLAALATTPARLILVSNEVGSGVVPATASGRAFRDAQGRLNQRVAQAVDNVVLVTAGLPMALKTNGRPTYG